jgi:hypothetical protein
MLTRARADEGSLTTSERAQTQVCQEEAVLLTSGFSLVSMRNEVEQLLCALPISLDRESVAPSQGSSQ